MKFKIPKPEDYPEIEMAAFRLAHAYCELYGDTIDILVRTSITLDALKEGDEFSLEWAINSLQSIMDEYKIR